MHIILFLIFLGAAPVIAATNPMEQLLQKQIAEQRYQKMKARKQRNASRSSSSIKLKKSKTKIKHKTPPHKIILIAGIGKKLYAHLTTPQKTILIVRVGDKIDFDNMQFEVVLINTKCVILKRGNRNYEIPFIAI